MKSEHPGNTINDLQKTKQNTKNNTHTLFQQLHNLETLHVLSQFAGVHTFGLAIIHFFS